jgi:outer membrane protein assembly factor BamB
MHPAIGPDGLVFGADRRDKDDRFEFTEKDGFTGFTAIGPDGTDRWEVSQRSRHAAPTIVGNTVFLTSAGITQAIDRRDGSRFWRYEAGAGQLEVSPTAVDGTIYVCGDAVYALDARTGERQWSSLGREPALSGTAATSDALYAAAGDSGEGGIYRIDPADGSRIWTAPDVGECYTHPVVGTDHVYAVETIGRLHALDPASGRTRWSHSLEGSVYIPPAVADDTVYVAGKKDEYFYALSAHDGAVEWKRRFGLYNPAAPTLVDGTVYLPVGVQDSGVLNAYDRASGEQRHQWTLPLRPSASLALGNTYGVICTGETTKEGRVFVLQ